MKPVIMLDCFVCWRCGEIFRLSDHISYIFVSMYTRPRFNTYLNTSTWFLLFRTTLQNLSEYVYLIFLLFNSTRTTLSSIFTRNDWQHVHPMAVLGYSRFCSFSTPMCVRHLYTDANMFACIFTHQCKYKGQRRNSIARWQAYSCARRVRCQ